MKKMILRLLIGCLAIAICLPIKLNSVNAIESRAIERYTKSINVNCHNPDWGYVTVAVTISHNMTTGRFTVDSVKGTPHFNMRWPGLTLLETYTDPSVGQVINGSIKVTIKYYNKAVAGMTWDNYAWLSL